jgi:acyl-coenzyme A synthetase/AMP-(fatty) acid ligase
MIDLACCFQLCLPLEWARRCRQEPAREGDMLTIRFPQIPRTPSGKMLRREMRDRYHARLKREAKLAKL